MYAVELVVVKLKWLASRGRNNPKRCDLIIEVKLGGEGSPRSKPSIQETAPRLSPSEMAREIP